MYLQNNSSPNLSIIIPVYNGSLYLEHTISTIMSQPCKDFELLLIDDGSTDNSLYICQQAAKLYDNIRVTTRGNKGVSLTRNEGIEMSRGRIIIFFDQDDAMRKNFYTESMRDNILKQFEDGIDMILPGRWQGNETLKRGHYLPIEYHISGIRTGHQAEESFITYGPFHQNIFSRSLFFDENNHPTPVRFLPLKVDVETTFRHMTQYAARKLLYSDDFAFSVRRENRQSVSSKWNFLKVHYVRCDAYWRLIDWHKEYYSRDEASIITAEKHFLATVEYMIEDYCKAKQDLPKLLDTLKEKEFYIDLVTLAKKYPESSENFKILNDHNYLVLKENYNVPLWKKVIRLRWPIINFFHKLEEEKSLSSVI